MIGPSKLIAIAACACAVSACKTPQAALDQANNGAALTVSLQSQLSALRSTQALIARGRIDSIRSQRELMAKYQADSAFDERVRAAAGSNAEATLASELRTLADSRAKDQQDLAEQIAAINANLATVLQPVPEQDARLGATQKAMAMLGEQMPLKQRAEVIAAFAHDLKKEIDNNKEKSKAAKSVPDQAPVQSAPPGKPDAANADQDHPG
jgi:hypothetical protein